MSGVKKLRLWFSKETELPRRQFVILFSSSPLIVFRSSD
jgi:hypothetical protein